MKWPKLWSSSDEEQVANSTSSLTDRVRITTQELIETLDHKTSSLADQTTSEPASALRIFTEPQTIIAAVILTTGALGCVKVYRTYLRRIPEALNIHQSYYRKRSIFGKVTSVGDGDNFRIFHTPGGWLAGWGWVPWKKVPKDKKLLKNQTIHVRIAGVDAPECAHFGRTAQPYSREALEWLSAYLRNRRIRAYVHRPDQYGRVVATAYVWKGLLRRDIGLQMLKAGLATVYEAKSGAEFGGKEQEYRQAEQWAKSKKRGMWAGHRQDYESPREYKRRHSG